MNARDWALRQLDSRRLPGWKLNCLGQRKVHAPSDARDLALAEQITIGVVKNLFLLEHQLAHFSGRPLEKMDALVRKIMVIGFYQLQFMQRIPASAAVNEAVEQAKRFGRGKSAGFVNAVLRNATRDSVPPLPDAISDPVEYARAALSHPPELFERVQRLLGVERALDFCRHDNEEPPTILRLAPEIDSATLSSDTIALTPHELAGMFVVNGARQADFAKWAEAGIAQVQDPTSAQVVEHLDLHPGQRILDRCGGLGTKTLQIRQRLGESGAIVAMDMSSWRCDELRKLIARRGLTSIEVFNTQWMKGIPPGDFDRILIDAPCSNSGVLARRPEARYFQDDQTLAALEKIQRHILDDTAGRLKPGGIMVYSTCSIWPVENQQQVAKLLKSHPAFHFVRELTTLPSPNNPNPAGYHDGGYFAVLQSADQPGTGV